MKTIVTLCLTFILGTQFTYGQIKQDGKKTRISLEIDPATFFMKGYGIHIRIQPKTCHHLLYGIGVYSLDLPQEMVNMNKNNKDWNVRIKQGISLFGEHHFTKVNKKWFIGGQFGVQTFTIEKKQIKTNSEFKNILTMSYLGYTFNPFNNRLYIKPWMGIGYTRKISGKNTIKSNEYDISPITMFATLHIGYTF